MPQLPIMPTMPLINRIEFATKLEQRLLFLSKQAYLFVRNLSKDVANREYADQFLRSVSSVGANYIEANESESRKDFFHRIKICRKETKEALYWLDLIIFANPSLKQNSDFIEKELNEMLKLFSSILKSNN